MELKVEVRNLEAVKRELARLSRAPVGKSLGGAFRLL
jgi:hypothetical protein